MWKYMFNNYSTGQYSIQRGMIMSKTYSMWSDAEVKTLFKFVEVKKYEGKPLIKIFNEYAKCTKRQPNSVRNYYYKELENLQGSPDRCKRLDINLDFHEAKPVLPFSSEDTSKLISNINDLLSQGYSVRGACLKLADGNARAMIRLQNKYRLETKYKKENNMGNIIKMPIKKETISDNEINALFLGLIKLVKKQEEERIKQKYEEQINASNQKLKDAMTDIILNKYKVEKLQEQIKLLQDKNEKLKSKQIQARINGLKHTKSAKSIIEKFVNGKTDVKLGSHIKSGIQ